MFGSFDQIAAGPRARAGTRGGFWTRRAAHGPDTDVRRPRRARAGTARPCGAQASLAAAAPKVWPKLAEPFIDRFKVIWSPGFKIISCHAGYSAAQACPAVARARLGGDCDREEPLHEHPERRARARAVPAFRALPLGYIGIPRGPRTSYTQDDLVICAHIIDPVKLDAPAAARAHPAEQAPLRPFSSGRAASPPSEPTAGAQLRPRPCHLDRRDALAVVELELDRLPLGGDGRDDALAPGEEL
eukprot:CAMPEP_0179844830 /NCGR_PEP_ID=MMETSP0982-20121206/4573_1 /TAXON_ID=483367 /ORGANISM="non described non described, Strain CCMP 2436" /LENGTH=243 /DNA_ID=CAMNT_0021729603 /DNA_START=474 /DNA_END=1203 /DNA_ORIENTATION=-